MANATINEAHSGGDSPTNEADPSDTNRWLMLGIGFLLGAVAVALLASALVLVWQLSINAQDAARAHEKYELADRGYRDAAFEIETAERQLAQIKEHESKNRDEERRQNGTKSGPKGPPIAFAAKPKQGAESDLGEQVRTLEAEDRDLRGRQHDLDDDRALADDEIKALESPRATKIGELGAEASFVSFLLFLGTIVSVIIALKQIAMDRKRHIEQLAFARDQFAHSQETASKQWELANEQVRLGETWKYNEFLVSQLEDFTSDRAIKNVRRILEWVDANYPLYLEFECVPSFVKEGYGDDRSSGVSFPSVTDEGRLQRLHVRIDLKKIVKQAFIPDDEYVGERPYLENLIAYDIDRFCGFLLAMENLEELNSKSLTRVNELRGVDSVSLLNLIDIYWFTLFVKSDSDDNDEYGGNAMRKQLRTYMMEYTPEVVKFFRDRKDEITNYRSNAVKNAKDEGNIDNAPVNIRVAAVQSDNAPPNVGEGAVKTGKDEGKCDFKPWF